MKRKVLAIGHGDDETDDAASIWAEARGFAVDWRFPYRGDRLPVLGDIYAGVIVYGGRFDVEPRGENLFLRDEARLIERAMAGDTPVLGICLGGQLVADVLGVPVGPHPQGCVEYGFYRLQPEDGGEALFGDDFTVLESHWHGWYATPAGAKPLASSALFPCQAFRHGRTYAFQFHPETSRATLARWIDRRGQRNYLPGAHPPVRQLADHDRYSGRIGVWLARFLDQWIAGGVDG